MKSINKISFLVSLFSVLSSVMFAQSVSIETKLDTHKIELGARAELSYVIEKEKGQKIIFPNLSDTLSSLIELSGKPTTDSVKIDGDKVRLTRKMNITSFEEGNQYIPSQIFGIVNGDRIDTIMSSSTYLEVVGVALDTTGVVKDIGYVKKAPFTIRDFLLIVLIIVVILLPFVIIYFIRRKGENKSIINLPRKPLDPPYIVALRELDKLKAQKLWQQQQLKDYYSQLTHIVRVFIGRTFGVATLEKTSAEIIRDLKSSKVDKVLDIKVLQELLSLADLIKFAKGQADPEENIRHLENAYAIVKAVQPSGEKKDNNTEKNQKEEEIK